MKKALCLLTLLFIVSAAGFAQKVNLKWGPELEERRNSTINTIIGKTDKAIFALRVKSGSMFSGKTISLDSYDVNSMNLNYSKELEIPETPQTKSNDYSLEECILLKGKMYLYASTYDKRADTKTAVVFDVDLATGVVDSKFQKVDEITDLNKKSRGSFDYALSEDSTKILFYHSAKVDKNSPDKYSAKLYDSDFKLIWKKDFETKEANRDVELHGFNIDTDGTFYQLVKLKDRTTNSKSLPDYKYVINAYLPATDEMKVFDMTIGEKFITDIRFEISKDGDLACAGFYSDRNKNTGKNMDAKFDRASGVFYMKIDKKTKAVKATQIKEFDKDVMLAVMRNKRKAEKQEDISNFDIRDFVFNSNGGMMMIAEQYRLVVTVYSDGKGHTTTVYTYYYDNILVANFSGEGVKWIKVINKYQVSTNDGGFYSSFLKLVSDDKLMFIYNDDKDNVDLKDESDREIMKSPKKAVTMLTTIDQAGKITTVPLFSSKDLETICRPKISYQEKDGEAIIFSERRGNYRFGRVSVDETAK